MAELPTLNSVILDSDEDDGDYVPAQQDSDSESDAGPKTKKPRTEDTLDTPSTSLLKDEAARNTLWNSFLESTKAEATDSKSSTPKPEVKTITIEKKYRFAGEDVTEKIVVAEDSSEAQEWRKRQFTGGKDTRSTGTPVVSTPGSGSSTPSAGPLFPLETNDVTEEMPPPTKAKPPTKPRKSLSSLAAAGKPKKLTTLEKSRLDWRSHLASGTQEERDELEQNRKEGGAGYLEKVDFLARVGERRENVFEDSKRKRR